MPRRPPDKDAHHDCDQCALRLTAVLAAPPPVSVPRPVGDGVLTLHSAGPAVAAGGPTWPARRPGARRWPEPKPRLVASATT